MRFFYLRDENNNPIGCLASQLNEAKDTISFAVSVCNPLDQFKKQQAKEIAAGRLVLGSNDWILYNDSTKGKTKQCIMGVLADKEYDYPQKYSQRVKEAAKRWLDNHKT